MILLRSLYGLKSAPQIWNKILNPADYEPLDPVDPIKVTFKGKGRGPANAKKRKRDDDDDDNDNEEDEDGDGSSMDGDHAC